MAKIIMSIHGPGAVEACRNLVNIQKENIIHQEFKEGDFREGITLSTIAIIVGIIGGALGIADKIIEWYNKFKKEKKIEKVVLIINNHKVLLENLSVEQLSEFLKTLPNENNEQ